MYQVTADGISGNPIPSQLCKPQYSSKGQPTTTNLTKSNATAATARQWRYSLRAHSVRNIIKTLLPFCICSLSTLYSHLLKTSLPPLPLLPTSHSAYRVQSTFSLLLSSSCTGTNAAFRHMSTINTPHTQRVCIQSTDRHIRSSAHRMHTYMVCYILIVTVCCYRWCCMDSTCRCTTPHPLYTDITHGETERASWTVQISYSNYPTLHT